MMQAKDIRGVYTALATPLNEAGQIDEAAFAALINWQIEQGVHGLVPMGTTGESPTMTPAEHKLATEVCVKAAAGRVPVMAGTGSNSTDEAIEFTVHAAEVGADSALVVSPYYNKPNAEGMYQHFKAIHDAAEIPLIIYNIPGRSVVDMPDALLARLSELPHVVGVKDATGDLSRVATLRQKVGDALAMISGEDMTAVGFNAMGGQGCISVTANVAPRLCADLQEAALRGDFAEARRIQDLLTPLHDVMFAETSPIPVKAALALLGRAKPILRLPLVEATKDTYAGLESAMQSLDLI